MGAVPGVEGDVPSVEEVVAGVVVLQPHTGLGHPGAHLRTG